MALIHDEQTFAKVYKSPHANHVLQKLIEFMPSDCVAVLIERILEKGGEGIITFAKHKYACRVLERLIENDKPGSRLPEISCVIVRNSLGLWKHKNGNYVSKALLVDGTPEDRAEVFNLVSTSLPILAKHRIASHLVQTLFEKIGEAIVEERLSRRNL